MSLYLVTGGAGFIGSHLCDALIARGDDVRILDDLSTGHRANLPTDAELVRGMSLIGSSASSCQRCGRLLHQPDCVCRARHHSFAWHASGDLTGTSHCLI